MIMIICYNGENRFLSSRFHLAQSATEIMGWQGFFFSAGLESEGLMDSFLILRKKQGQVWRSCIEFTHNVEF